MKSGAPVMGASSFVLLGEEMFNVTGAMFRLNGLKVSNDLANPSGETVIYFDGHFPTKEKGYHYVTGILKKVDEEWFIFTKWKMKDVDLRVTINPNKMYFALASIENVVSNKDNAAHCYPRLPRGNKKCKICGKPADVTLHSYGNKPRCTTLRRHSICKSCLRNGKKIKTTAANRCRICGELHPNRLVFEETATRNSEEIIHRVQVHAACAWQVGRHIVPSFPSGWRKYGGKIEIVEPEIVIAATS